MRLLLRHLSSHRSSYSRNKTCANDLFKPEACPVCADIFPDGGSEVSPECFPVYPPTFQCILCALHVGYLFVALELCHQCISSLALRTVPYRSFAHLHMR